MAKIIIKSKSGWIKIKLKGSKFRNFLDGISEIAPVFNEAIQHQLKRNEVKPADYEKMYPHCIVFEACIAEKHLPWCPKANHA